MVAVDPRPFLHQAVRWTAALAAGLALIVGLRWDWSLGLSIWIGAGLGVGNLWLLGTTLGTLVEEVEPDKPQARRYVLPGVLLLKLPLLMAAMLLLVKFLPVRLEGVAMGVVVALVGACLAGFEQKARAEGPPPDDV